MARNERNRRWKVDPANLFAVAFLGFGVAGLLLGVSFTVSEGGTTTLAGGLVGVTLLLFGVASLLAGLTVLDRPELWQRVLAWLTQSPAAGDVQ
jgi:hypothetical protein